MQHRLFKWKQPAILLTAIGISGIGDLIYLVGINLLIYQMTGSAAAVAGLWIIGPAVNVLTKLWTGSFIDYRSKRKIMIVTDIVRAILVFTIPFLPNIWLIYFVLIFISAAKSFFAPTSMTYITQLVPIEMRKQYNAIQSLTLSGAFIVGPAVAGTLILISSVDIAIFINAASFLISALLLCLLPDKETLEKDAIPSFSYTQIRADWFTVFGFFKEKKYVAFVYSTYLATMIFSMSMDAQEVVFTQKVVGLSEIDYSLLISITGIGAIVGAFIVTFFSKRFSLKLLITTGMIMETFGYLLYAFSWSFLSIAVGFIILGLFNAFLNAGMMTFYQNNVPTKLMGRVTSIFQLIQSAFQIVFVLLVGAIADMIPLRITIVALATMMLGVAIYLVMLVVNPNKKIFFEEK